jgi:hypothetical protein
VRAAFVFPAVGDPGYDACATQHESRRYKPRARPAIDKRERSAMKVSASIALAATAAAVLAAATLLPRAHAESQINRGKYLVTLAGCNDCDTPGYFFGKPDMARYLGGSEVALCHRKRVQTIHHGVLLAMSQLPPNPLGVTRRPVSSRGAGGA